MIIIIIGCGGRENILSEKLNNGHNKLYCIGEWINPDIQKNVVSYFKTSISNIHEILSCIKKINPDLIVVGPESILETSLIDQCTKLGFKCIGPNKNLAQLETSKIFTRNLLSEMNEEKYNPIYFSLDENNYETKIINFINEQNKSFVIKLNGLAGGKGVFVQGDHFEKTEDGINIIKNS